MTDTHLDERTRLDDARASFLEHCAPLDAESVSLDMASGRILADPLDASRPVPHYRRAAMDGYAVRAADTFDASERSPVGLDVTNDIPDTGEAVRVHTGSALPDAADAVVRLEDTDPDGERVAVFDAVGVGANVAPVGEDVAAEERLFDAGHRLRPSDVGLLRATGHANVPVRRRPDVAVVPTGEELVAADPAPGEVVETNGLVVAACVRAWGGVPNRHDPVDDDPDELGVALRRAAAPADVLVTTGGSSVGERDLVPETVERLGGLDFHGVALKPGHPVAAGVVDDTPTLVLPGYPVSCLVNAVQFLRPALAALAGTDLPALPTTDALLARKIRSEPGVRTFARVRFDGGEATPISAAGAGVLSSVSRADGWVEVPERREGIPANETVTVREWEP